MSELYLSSLEALFDGKESSIAKDIKFNLNKFLKESALSPTEAILAFLANARAVGFVKGESIAAAEAAALGIPPEHIQEAREAAALMGLLNTYYKFRYMLEGAAGPSAVEPYKAAGLRMMSLSRPQMGKMQFEMLEFTVSVLNGCQSCIAAHEKELRALDVSKEKIHDLVRIAASVKAAQVLLE